MQALVRLMTIPQHALVRGRGGKKYGRTHKQLSNQIQKSLDAFNNNNFVSAAPAQPLNSSKTTPETARALRANALVSSGYISRATRSLTQEGLLSINTESCKKLA